jgi:hypothetical protein
MLAYYQLMIPLPNRPMGFMVCFFQRMCLALTILGQLYMMRRFLHQTLLLVLVRYLLDFTFYLSSH